MIEKLINIHSPGYIIEIYNNGKEDEYVYEYDKNTLFDIASLTKFFTATLTYIAYEEKLIDLYDTIYDIDNNFINLKNVRIIDLLSHNQNIWTEGYIGNSNTIDEFYKILYSSYVKDNNKTYVDIHYIILSTLLEKIYNKSFDKLCIEKIFNKLNMKDTTFNPDPNRCANNNFEHINGIEITDVYPGVIHDKKARTAKNLGIYTGHASLFTTATDLLIFLKSFFEYTLLKKETIDFMLKHEDIDSYNYNILKNNIGGTDINDMYNTMISKDLKLPVAKTYNNCGTRYRNKINLLNDIPNTASNNTITFSGYTGPTFTIYFDNKIIIIVMCSVVYNSKLSREDRKRKTYDIIDEIYKKLD